MDEEMVRARKAELLDRLREGREVDGEAAAMCAALSDGELLDLLREIAGRLGHSPAQGEVHQLLRDCLRSRFKNWPGALRAAGLSRSAGRGGVTTEQMAREEAEYRQLLAQVREAAERLGRMPHPSELPEICGKLEKRCRSWGEVLSAAGAEEAVAGSLRKAEDLGEEDRARLDRLRAIALALNRAPMRGEVEAALREPLLRRFGSWRSVLYQIDLEPVQRIAPFVNAPLRREEGRARAAHRGDLYDCRYRLLRLTPETEADLALVRELAEQLGRPPRRQEVSPEIRRRLQAACGSWSNALFQLDLREEPDHNGNTARADRAYPHDETGRKGEE